MSLSTNTKGEVNIGRYGCPYHYDGKLPDFKVTSPASIADHCICSETVELRTISHHGQQNLAVQHFQASKAKLFC